MELMCSKCGEVKKEEDFSVNKKAVERNERHNYCRTCMRAYVKQWKIDNPDKTKKYTSTYSIRNREHINSKSRIYMAERRKDTTYREQCAEYYQNNKERLNVIKKKWKKDNPYKVKVMNKRAYDNNKVSLARKEKERRLSDPVFHTKKLMRENFRSWLRGKQKTCSVMNLIGLPIEEFKQWIESQFQDGMSWENRREWHIDHYVPLDYFDPANEDDMKICWHYLNLRPLWASDNIRKGNTLPDDYLKHIDKIKQAVTISP